MTRKFNKEDGTMISKKMAKAINTQINRGFYSAFLYLAMANDAMETGFKGAASSGRLSRLFPLSPSVKMR